MQASKYVLFITLLQTTFAGLAMAESISGSPQASPSDSTSYYKIVVSSQSKYIRDQDVITGACISSGNHGGYFFRAAGKPTTVNTIKSIDKCRESSWSDTCDPVALDTLTIETQKTVSEDRSIIFESSSVSGWDNCGKDIQLWEIRNEYSDSVSESHTYQVNSVEEILSKLNIVR